MIKYECCRCWNQFELKELNFLECSEYLEHYTYCCPKCGGSHFEVFKEEKK